MNNTDPWEKDCTCLDWVHTVPHWLHMDAFERVRNQRHLDNRNYAALIILEPIRLRELRREMTRRGTSVIPAEIIGRAIQEVKEQGARHRRYRAEEARSRLPALLRRSTQIARGLDYCITTAEKETLRAQLNATEALIGECRAAIAVEDEETP